MSFSWLCKKGRVGRLSRRPTGHGGCSIPTNQWTNAGGSIDEHLPIAWRVPYKRVYPRLKVGDAIDASIPMHGEGRMPQAAVLRMSLRVPARNEWSEWMSAPHDCDMCPSNMREESMDRLSLEWGKERIGVWKYPGGHCKPSAVCDQEHSKQSFPYDIPLGMLRRRVVSSLAQEEARLRWDFGPRVHPFPTILTDSSTHDALVKKIMDLKEKTVGKVDLGASSGAKWKNGEVAEGSQHHTTGYTEKQPLPHYRQCKWGYWGVGQNAQHPWVSPWKRGGNPKETGIPPHHEKDGDLSVTTFGVSERYPKKLGRRRTL